MKLKTIALAFCIAGISWSAQAQDWTGYTYSIRINHSGRQRYAAHQ